MHLLKICFSLLLLVSIAGCKKSDTQATNQTVAKTILNVSYGTELLQKMDVYLPPNRSANSTKVMVMIHGGSWTGGDKNDFNAYVDTMKRRLPEYAIFNINYRLAAGASNLFPTQENDVRKAIEFIYDKRSEYEVSDQLVIVGASAGGHLAMLQAYKYSSPVKVKAVVDFFGPTDMRAMYENPTIPGGEIPIYNVMGQTPAQDSLLYAHSSPVNYINASSPPTILLHGGIDILVRPSQSENAFNKLQSFSVATEYVFYPMENHGWTGNNLHDSFNRIMAFLQTHVP